MSFTCTPDFLFFSLVLFRAIFGKHKTKRSVSILRFNHESVDKRQEQIISPL
jgi:hypothetical protein